MLHHRTIFFHNCICFYLDFCCKVMEDSDPCQKLSCFSSPLVETNRHFWTNRPHPFDFCRKCGLITRFSFPLVFCPFPPTKLQLYYHPLTPYAAILRQMPSYPPLSSQQYIFVTLNDACLRLWGYIINTVNRHCLPP